MCMRGRLCIMYLPKRNVTDFPNLGYSSSWLDTFCVIVMLINSYFSGQRSDIHAVTHLKFVHIRNKEKCCRNLFSRFNLGTKWLRATLTGESQFLSFLWTLHAPLKCWVTFPLGCSVPFQYQKICMFSACDKNWTLVSFGCSSHECMWHYLKICPDADRCRPQNLQWVVSRLLTTKLKHRRP